MRSINCYNLCFSVSNTCFLHRIFWQTPLLLIYVLAVIFGFCAGQYADFFTFSCLLLSSYIFSTSILIFFVCNVKSRRSWVECLIGIQFREKFTPRKGLSNMLILCSLVVVFLTIDIVSVIYIISSKWKECDNLSLIINTFIQTNQWVQVENALNARKDLLESIPNTKGVISQLNIHPFFIYIHNLFCEFKV